MSKATEALAAQLAPGSKTPRAEQYKIAWDLLLHLPEADQWHRSQAKCWLTYRAFDGQITLEDWQKHIKHVKPTPTSWMKTRWDVSQATAEAYLWLHRGDDEQRVSLGIKAAERVLAMESRLSQYPPTILNWLRIVAILAVRKWVMGEDEGAKDLINRGVKRWRDVISSFHWRNHPTRFPEMLGDAWALSALMMLAQRLKITQHMIDRPWINPEVVIKHNRTEPWIICMRRLQERADTDRVFFLIKKPARIITESSPGPIATRADLAATFCGQGVELGVARGQFSATILANPNVTRLWSIDKWNDHHDLKEYMAASELLAGAGAGKCIPLRMTFEEAASLVNNLSMDFCYVDGYAHLGQEGGKTLDQWWEKLKPGGVFSGHDYHSDFPKTIAAVDSFVKKHGVSLSVTKEGKYPSWWVRKPVP